MTERDTSLWKPACAAVGSDALLRRLQRWLRPAWRILLLSLCLAVTPSRIICAQGLSVARSETRYLGFQVFTGAPDPAVAIGGSGIHPLGPLPSPATLNRFVQDVVRRIGTVGTRQRRLAVIFGPLAFDHSDSELRRFIAQVFALAQRQNVAVGFHLDDSMFWARRSDLWRNPDNIEWLDWQGTPTTGRRIDWGPQPQKLPPQMCYNSPVIRAEVRRRATQVFGKALKTGVDQLRRRGREDLFAGVIVGWETHIGQDFDTGRITGYHALTYRGYHAGHLPPDPDREREKIVQEFIAWWSRGLADAGVAPKKIYSHTAFMTRQNYAHLPPPAPSYSQLNHFAPPSVAFGKTHRPGFSTYPQPGLFAQIHREVAQHGNPGWASSEGTNLQLGTKPGQSGMTMETYLALMYNHGATLVNIFAWGVGGEANRKMSFRVATEGEDALRAYRKFLRGQRLIERPVTTPAFMQRLPAKIHRIQQELPAWVQRTGQPMRVEPWMRKLDAALKAQDFETAEKIADRLLAILSES